MRPSLWTADAHEMFNFAPHVRSHLFWALAPVVGAALVASVAMTWHISRRGPASSDTQRARPPAPAILVNGAAAAERSTVALATLRTAVTALAWVALVGALAVAWFGPPGHHSPGEYGLGGAALAAAWLLATWLVFVPRYRRSRRAVRPCL